MISVSTEFKKTMADRTNFMESAKITLANGDILNLAEKDFTVTNNSVSDGAGSSGFPFGVAVGKSIQIEIMNDEDQFSEYDFANAKIDLFLKFQLSSSAETIDYGVYTVVSPETYGTTIIIQAVDEMHKADKEYDTGLSYPLELGAAVRDSCATCGITLLTTTFKNSTFTIRKKPTGITHRQFLAYAAMIAGGFARMDYKGRLCIKTYDFEGLQSLKDLDGGRFDDSTPYSSGDSADGGSFAPWSTGYVYDSGTFSDQNAYHVLFNFSSLKVDVDDVVVTGVKVSADNNSYLAGKEGYVLSVSNPLLDGQEEAAAALLGETVIGAMFRPFSGDHIAYPLAEFGDIAYVIDRKGNAYKTIITDVDFNFFGITTLKCAADSPIRNSSKYNSQSAQAIVAAQKKTEELLSEYDKASQMLASLIARSGGLYTTEEIQENQSSIWYMHNKPTLGQSTTIWKMTADAFAVSTDGGKTWNAGLTADGNAIAQVLSVIGINFDWAKGRTLTLGGAGNENVILRILGSNNIEIGKWDKDGLVATAGKFSGSLSGATGTFSGELSAASGSFKGQLSGATGDFTGSITASSGYIGGKTGFVIDTNKIYKNKNALGANSNGIYIGTDGFACGKTVNNVSMFEVDQNGTLVMQNAFLRGNGMFVGYGTGFGADDNNNLHALFQLASNGNDVFVNAHNGTGGTLYLGAYDTHGVHCGAPLSDMDGNGVWGTASDRRLKKNVVPLNKEKSYEFIKSLIPSEYRYRKGAIRSDGDSGRSHHGFIAQDVIEAMHSDWSVVEEFNYIKKVGGKRVKRYSMRYEELIADIVAAFQYLAERVNEIEENNKYSH